MKKITIIKKTAAFKLREGSPTQQKLHQNILFFIL